MSPLAAYFEQHPTRRKAELARTIGITPGRVSQLCRKDRPSLALALRIKAATHGAVRPEDWYEPARAVSSPAEAAA